MTETTTEETKASIVTVSDAARAILLDLRTAEPDGAGLALRLDVVGQTVSEFTYELTFEPADGAGPEDSLGHSAELPVLVPAESVDKLRGSTLDHVEPTGLVLRNPNRPRPQLVPDEELVLEGSVEARLRQLLDGQVNPMLASHGGFAALDRIEGDTAYLLMGGGCQGCGLAELTLTEGIKAVIEDAIPEISRVEDVTDHAAGTNPFYEASEK